MLIPVCGERLPVRLEIAVKCAKGLPIMNRSINSTDAFVEVRFADEVEKTEVVTSLQPTWDSEFFHFDTDEKELAEQWIQFRVMDHDTYSANDAIGRVNLDCNMLVERMRMCNEENLENDFVLPIYDTLNGIRGDLTITVRIQLLIPYDFSNYVQILSGFQIPDGLQIVEIVGLLSELKTEKDPDYEWLDRIRSPRATNEARQTAIRETMRETAVSIAHKTIKHQCNLLVGYQEYLDVEGSSSDLYTVRVCGTALRIDHTRFAQECPDRAVFPILTIGKIPNDRQSGQGAMVAARAVHVLEEGEDSAATRKGWWNELRLELFQQALSVGCNMIIGYAEQVSVNDGIELIGCTGTAVVIGKEENFISDTSTIVSKTETLRDIPEKEKRSLFKANNEVREKRSDSTLKSSVICSYFHLPPQPPRIQVNMKTSLCQQCKMSQVSDFIISTAICPPQSYFIGPRNYVQVSVTKKIASDPSDKDDYAGEISNLIPFADHELYNNLVGECRNVNPYSNAVFDARCTFALSDDLLVTVLTGVLVRLVTIPKDDLVSPSLSNVLSFTNLQKNHDARRFSWGTVREAIRFKATVTPTITLKILNLKPDYLDDTTTTQKGRSRLNTIVGKMRRRQHEKEYMSHVVFERHMSSCIGLLEGQAAGNSTSIAGVHVAPNNGVSIMNKELANSHLILSRWSDVFVREDLSNTIKDSASVDQFATHCLEERIALAKGVTNLGGPLATVSLLRLACPQFNVSKEHAHMIILMSCDIVQQLST